MSVRFSGWEVIDDGAAFTATELDPSQKPHRHGVYTMYHGTTADIAKLIIGNGFQPSSGGMLGPGVYVSRDMKKASAYPRHQPSDQVVLELHVTPGRVKRIDTDALLKYDWHNNGYDTAWVPANCGMNAVPSGLEEDCVFSPWRVVVVGVAKASDATVQSELQDLVSKSHKKKRRGRGAADVCPQCKRKTQQGAPHKKERCWGCGQNICILTRKHFCPPKS